jgi:hypothetical protein
MTFAPRAASLLVLVSASVLGISACGGTGKTTTAVASLGATTTAAAAGGGGAAAASPTDAKDAILAYAQCMRDNGVDMPDPTFDANGRPQFNAPAAGAVPGDATVSTTAGGAGGGPRGGLDAGLRDDPDFDKARTACQSLQEAIREQFQPSAEEQAARREAVLKFAQCMRDNGVDFPDPTFDADGRIQFGGAAAADGTATTVAGADGGPGGRGGGGIGRIFNSTDPVIQKAVAACQADLGDTIRIGGRGLGGPPPDGAGVPPPDGAVTNVQPAQPAAGGTAA